METVHIIIEKIIEPSNDFNWLELIEFIVGILSTIVSIGVMVIGIRAINRLHLKGEDAIFNFLSRFSVYLELLKNSLGTSRNSVYYYRFTYDLRCNWYSEQTPSDDELNDFVSLSKEILDFLRDADNQFAITENFFLERKQLLQMLIKNINNLGKVFPYMSRNVNMSEEIAKDVKIIDNLLGEIDQYTKKTLSHYWKKFQKKNWAKK